MSGASTPAPGPAQRGTAAEAALAYLARGFAPIPIPRGSKAPVLPGWQNRQFTAADLPGYFADGANIGLLLGEPSGGLVDVDLDCAEAVPVAPAFLRATPMRHGRAGKPNSHWYYRCAPCPAPHKFTAPDGACLLEIRSTGQQTIVPPSVHPSGNALVWEGEGQPTEAKAATLAVEAGRLAAAALLLRCYPASGSRNEFCLALAGMLLRGKMPLEYAEHFIRELARAAGDEEWQARAQTLESTRERLDNGKAARGGSHLAKMLGADGEKIIASIRKWLRLEPGPGPAKGRPPATAAVLLGLQDEMELFHDGERRGYASFEIDGHFETWPIRSREFAHYLRRQHFGNAHAAIGSEALQNAIETFEAQAIFSGSQWAAHVRMTEQDGRYYLDLANDGWEAVEITASGWRVAANPPVKFLRPRGVLPLPTPAQGGSLAELRPFINVAEAADWTLILVWLLAALRPKGPYPVLALYGEHGSAKSTTARVLRSLIDPNRSPLRAAPRDTHELMIQASNAHLLCLDNLSGVPQSLSDALCRLATGGGFSARELYTDDGEKLFDAQRPILLNGIEDLCTRPDLLDRSIGIMLPPIPDNRREPEEQFWERFEAARPRILGALLDAVAAALNNLPLTKLTSFPRMADFARWGTALESGMGLPAGAFLRAYSANRQGANSLTLESSPVAVALGKFMEGRGDWQGTATELMRELNATDGELTRTGKGWPANARALGNALRRVAPNLRADGLNIAFEKEPSKKRSRVICLWKTVELASATSAPSAGLEIQAAVADDAGANVDGPDANGRLARDLFPNNSDVADNADGKMRGSAWSGAEQRSQNPPEGSAAPLADEYWGEV